MEIRKYREEDIPAMVRIWNKVVEEGVAFPQEEYLDEKSGREFFAEQSRAIAAWRRITARLRGCIFFTRTT